MNSDGIVTRGSLPHWYMPGFAHFVTYRLAGTIPPAPLAQWRRRRADRWQLGPPPGVAAGDYRARLHKEFFAAYDRYLAVHCRDRWLVDPRVGAMIRENLYHHHGTKYELLAWCIMPNHVHVLLQPFERRIAKYDAGSVDHVADAASIGESMDDEVRDARSPLSRIMHSLKSYTASRANRFLGRSGRFWQCESYDHWVRDLEELARIVNYIGRNPVEAGLCTHALEWELSSAFDRFRRDGSQSGLVGQVRDDWLRG